MAEAANSNVEVGLVLQGGGALGAYEFGAIIALLELMDRISAPGRSVKLVAVTGVSIGAINAACVVGAKDRADARRRLRALWADLTIKAAPYLPSMIGGNLSLFGVPTFYKPRPDLWSWLTWTSIYDTTPMLATLKKHIDFVALNASKTAFVITGVDVATGKLTRFVNRAKDATVKNPIGERHVLASGSLPPQFPWTHIDGISYWDGGIVDNTPIGDAIAGFSTDHNTDRFLIVMNLFRKSRPLPKNMIEVNDRLSELRYGNRLRQDASNAKAINELTETVTQLAALVPQSERDVNLQARIDGAERYKILDSITDIDLGDPILMAEAGLKMEGETSGGFRDFSEDTINRRRDEGHKLAHLQLSKLFSQRGLLAATVH